MEIPINVAVSYTALQFAQAAGLTHPSGGTNWEFDSTAPAPTGLTMTWTKLSGTPTAVGTWTVTMRALNSSYILVQTFPVTLAIVDPNAPPPPTPKPTPDANVWINEYDTAASYRVEIGGTVGKDLTGWKVEGYRLYGGALTLVGSGTIVIPAGATIGANGVYAATGGTSSTSRAVALVNPAGTVTEFIGTDTTPATAPTTGAAAGMTPVLVNPAGTGASVARVGAGVVAGDFTWERQPSTLGEPNTGQTFSAITPVVPEPEPEPDPTPDPTPDPEPFPGQDSLAPLVAAHIGRPYDLDTIQQAAGHLTTIRAFVWAYTRGRGFAARDIAVPVASVQAVIVSACTRLTSNPEQVTTYTAGDYSERGATMQGFTLPELAVLNGYRRRAA